MDSKQDFASTTPLLNYGRSPLGNFTYRMADMYCTHICDVLALCASSLPINAAAELFIADVSQEVSITARSSIAISTMCGLGYLYLKGRALFNRLSPIKKMKTSVADAVYGGAFGAAIAPAFYAYSYVATDTEFDSAFFAAWGVSIALGTVSGIPNGFVFDWSRRLLGGSHKERRGRFPLLKRLGEKVDKLAYGVRETIAVGSLCAAMVGLASVYEIHASYKGTSNIFPHTVKEMYCESLPEKLTEPFMDLCQRE